MDNIIKKNLRKSKIVIKFYRFIKTVMVWPLKFTSFKILNLSNFPLKDLFNPSKTSLLKIVSPYTKAGYPRLTNVYDLANEIESKKITGSFVECGTWKGGCSAVMGAITKRYHSNRQTWYLDSFEGMPAPTTEDGSETEEIMGETLKASEEDVKELIFTKLNLSPEQNIIVKGWFQDTIPNVKNNIGQIAILRLDADWYKGTLYCLRELYDQVVEGGYIIFDDYSRWEGCKKAVHEFYQEKNINPKMQFIGNYGHRVMYFKK